MDWSHKLVPEGLGNCSFDLLSEVCSDISSTKRDLLLTFKKSTIKKSVVLTLRVRLIGKSRLRSLQSNAKSENGFHLWEIRPQGESGFHGFPFYCLIGKSEKRFAKLFSWTAVVFLLIMHARARPLFIRTVCQILFRISQSNGTKEIQRQISQTQNPDFKI